MTSVKYIPIISVIFFFLSCGKSYTPEQQEYISSIEKSRAEKDEWMKSDSLSPFTRDTTTQFSPLKYYPVNPDFVFYSKLYNYSQQDTVSIFGTKGEERRVVRYGYVLWNREGIDIAITVYKGTSKKGIEYFSIWFTDKTTGKETYGVGRYLDFTYVSDPEHLYTIDFNLAYSPYCAYSPMYSCAIPSKEDYIDVAIEAGEKTFH
jgi:uncharacterized protein (DUF1684 family)